MKPDCLFEYGGYKDYTIFLENIENGKVDVPEGVTNIGSCQYMRCYGLSSIQLPDSLTCIDDYAFACSGLSSIEIPRNVTEIMEGAFYGCADLASIKISENVRKIGCNAFEGCEKLQSIEIPAGVEVIEDEAFKDCKNLKSIEIPDSVTKIGHCAFQGCESLTHIHLPQNLKELGESVFSFTGLVSILIPEGLAVIPDVCFSACEQLSAIIFPKNGVIEIGSWAFESCSSLRQIRIPNSVIKIGDGAFSGCTKLEHVEIPFGVTEISSDTFKACCELTSIVIPNSVEIIDSNAFEGCKKLQNIEIPDSVVKIGLWAFSGCSGITHIEIPESATEIYWDAFANCKQLASILVSPANTTYRSQNNCVLSKDGKTLIVGCKTSVIPADVTEIGDCSFEDCTELRSITIPNSVRRIRKFAFMGCTQLSSVVLPNTLEVIEMLSFCNCTSLATIELPDNVTTIEKEAFGGCNNLTVVKIPVSIKEIGDSAFKDCNNIKDLTICTKNIVCAETLLKNCGFEVSNIVLHVPIGTGYAYRQNDYFKQFREIIASYDGPFDDYNPSVHRPLHTTFSCEESQQVKYVFFDTETTGLPKDYNAPSSAINNWPRMIQLSWITVDKDGSIIKENDHVIYPEGFVIPIGASSINGISTEMARKIGEPIADVLEDFMCDVENSEILVGHNVSFDTHIVGAELIRLGKADTLTSKPSICTMQSTIDFCAIPGVKGFKYPKLQELHKKLFGYEFEDAHNALSDIRATLKCYLELKQRGIIGD